MVDSPADLNLSGSITVDATTGMIDGHAEVPSFLQAAAAGGNDIRVLVVRRLSLGDVRIVTDPPPPPGVFGTVPPAVAFLATEDITVSGTVSLPANGPSAGGHRFGCDNQDATGAAEPTTPETTLGFGGGGGGFASKGGAGGHFVPDTMYSPRKGGSVNGNAPLVPLRGGCPGSVLNADGGGALQLTSLSRITLNGTIDVRGGAGTRELQTVEGHTLYFVSGGGSGGALLLEAPAVALGASARILATGGSGASRDNDGTRSLDGREIAGGACISAATCSPGGWAAGLNTNAAPARFEATQGEDLANWA